MIDKKGNFFEMCFLAREERYDRQISNHSIVLIEASWNILGLVGLSRLLNFLEQKNVFFLSLNDRQEGKFL